MVGVGMSQAPEKRTGIFSIRNSDYTGGNSDYTGEWCQAALAWHGSCGLMGQTGMNRVSNSQGLPPRFALFKSLDSAPVLGAANGTHLTCEMWCNTHLENEVRT
jgi:hypothetical protein